eukprot:94057-Prorocentrum_minimum.AAC.2
MNTLASTPENAGRGDHLYRAIHLACPAVAVRFIPEVPPVHSAVSYSVGIPGLLCARRLIRP